MVSLAAPDATALTSATDLLEPILGGSIRLALTPPALPSAYSHVHVYYRQVGIGAGTVWLSGGTYVGAQGVAGTVDVTGLTANEVYEFVAVTEDPAGLLSLPSIPCRGRPTTGLGTVFESVLRALKSQLGLIQVAGGYSCNVVSVHRFPETMARTDGGFPAVFMDISKVSAKFGPLYGANSGQIFTAPVTLQAWCHPELGGPDSAQAAAELLRADLLQAVGTDDTLGGTAVHAHPEPGFKLVADEDRNQWRGVHQDVTIIFRHTMDNAYKRVP